MVVAIMTSQENVQYPHTSKPYRDRHTELRAIFNAGFIRQRSYNYDPDYIQSVTKTRSKREIPINQNAWYNIVSWAKNALHTSDLNDYRINTYMFILGMLWGDNLPLTSTSVICLEAVSLYEYYINLEGEYTARYFKEELLSDWMSIESTTAPATVYSWFYKQGIAFKSQDLYPVSLFASVAFLALSSNNVVPERREIKTDFYKFITQTTPTPPIYIWDEIKEVQRKLREGDEIKEVQRKLREGEDLTPEPISKRVQPRLSFLQKDP